MAKFKGINLGSWLLMEGYILGGRNLPEYMFKREFAKRYGRKELINFENSFRKAFIGQDDIKRIASWGANCIRVPFNFRLIEEEPYKYRKSGLRILKTLVTWAEKYKVGLILDLHAAAGCQNQDWHSDSNGEALLWTRKDYQERTIGLWQYLVNEFKDNRTIVGYDILNEPVIERYKIATLKNFYKRLIKKIREIDAGHTIFLEGNIWAQEIDFLKDLLDDNTQVSIHTYQPLDFTFNFRPQYKYPGLIGKVRWNKSFMKKRLEKYKEFSLRNRVDIFVGEFGVNYRGGLFGELRWLKDSLDIFTEWGFNWAYWTYKAVAHHVFPDGIMQYLENPSWVSRESPIWGWENYLLLWAKHKDKIIGSLKTGKFRPNQDIISILKTYFKKKGLT